MLRNEDEKEEEGRTREWKGKEDEGRGGKKGRGGVLARASRYLQYWNEKEKEKKKEKNKNPSLVWVVHSH